MTALCLILPAPPAVDAEAKSATYPLGMGKPPPWTVGRLGSKEVDTFFLLRPLRQCFLSSWPRATSGCAHHFSEDVRSF